MAELLEGVQLFPQVLLNVKVRPGFDWKAYLEFSAERVFDLHGRGIAMSKAVSFDSLEYQGNGNTVVALVKLPQPGCGRGG